MTERIVHADGIELATEAFGDPAHPPVLLVMGAMASMLWWPDGFCQLLAGNDRYVLRYDNRDTGRSTTNEPGSPGYTFDDMADDAIRVLDGYGVPAAHVVGMSMGGMLAQLAAARHPARVRSLTVMSSSPLGEDTSQLPGPTAAYMEHAAQGANVDWTNRGEVIRFMVAESRAIAGSAHPFDEAGATRLMERDYDRARNFASATNHFNLKGGDSKKERLSEVKPPLLIIHGTADPLFPIEHGAAFRQVMPDATLVRIEGGGHELHRADWDEIIQAVVAHTSR